MVDSDQFAMSTKFGQLVHGILSVVGNVFVYVQKTQLIFTDLEQLDIPKRLVRHVFEVAARLYEFPAFANVSQVETFKCVLCSVVVQTTVDVNMSPSKDAAQMRLALSIHNLKLSTFACLDHVKLCFKVFIASLLVVFASSYHCKWTRRESSIQLFDGVNNAGRAVSSCTIQQTLQCFCFEVACLRFD